MREHQDESLAEYESFPSGCSRFVCPRNACSSAAVKRLHSADAEKGKDYVYYSVFNYLFMAKQTWALSDSLLSVPISESSPAKIIIAPPFTTKVC